MTVGDLVGDWIGGELLRGEFADRLEHPHAFTGSPHEALVEQGREHVQVGVAHGLDRVDRRSAGEDGERCEQLTLGLVEQIVRPGDRGTKRLLARIGIAAALQPVEATAEPRQDLGRCEKAGPRGRELDRERKVVEP